MFKNSLSNILCQMCAHHASGEFTTFNPPLQPKFGKNKGGGVKCKFPKIFPCLTDLKRRLRRAKHKKQFEIFTPALRNILKILPPLHPSENFWKCCPLPLRNIWKVPSEKFWKIYRRLTLWISGWRGKIVKKFLGQGRQNFQTCPKGWLR